MKPFRIGNTDVSPGANLKLELPVARLYTDDEISIPIYVKRAKVDGPTVFVNAAIHGNEINGIEIIRRLIQRKNFKLQKGTLVLVPIVNVYGLLNQSRYMPDRRDLNRSFPGSAKGSLAGRVANIFLTEVVNQCDYGIDVHTGALHRRNYPQIRANLEDQETMELAKCFGVPVLINSNLRDGSLRQAAAENNTKVLLFEAGEALRFDELSIRVGIRGVMNVLAKLEMITPRKQKQTVDPFIAKSSQWVRATSSGFVQDLKQLGDYVTKGTELAKIGDPFGEVKDVVYAQSSGVIIGQQKIPLVQEGDAMYHIASFEAASEIVEQIESLQESIFL